MSEPDTTLTDLGLALLCLGFVLALFGTAGPASLYMLLFAALGLASFLGALWHGWFSGQIAGIGGALWLGVIAAVGVANLALWLIGGAIAGATTLVVVGWLQLAVYLALAVFVTRSFALPSAFSLPPVLAMIALHGRRLAEGGSASDAIALAGFATALLAAGFRAARMGLPALGLGHNGLYHVVQALAFTLVFCSLP